MSEDANAAPNRPSKSLDSVTRVHDVVVGLEVGVFEDAISFLQALESSEKDLGPGKHQESEALAPLTRRTAMQTLRLGLRFARHGYERSQAEGARDFKRYEVYACMSAREREHLAEALSGSVADRVLDLLVLEMLEE